MLGVGFISQVIQGGTLGELEGTKGQQNERGEAYMYAGIGLGWFQWVMSGGFPSVLS